MKMIRKILFVLLALWFVAFPLVHTHGINEAHNDHCLACSWGQSVFTSTVDIVFIAPAYDNLGTVAGKTCVSLFNPLKELCSNKAPPQASLFA